MEMKYLDYVGLEHLITEIKSRYVQQATGKGLTENDFTNALKTKLDEIEATAEINTIELIKRNGSNLSIDANKAVDIAVPTKYSDLSNDKTYQTKAEILSLIADKGKMKKEIVTTLPAVATADDNTFYLVRNTQDTGYVEWMVINGAWEILGDTASVDFTGYVKETDLVKITNTEITAILNV